MKKLMSILVVAIMVMSLAVAVSAQDVSIELSADNWDANCGASIGDTTFADGTMTTNDPIVCLEIPAEVALGDTVTVTIKGSSVGDFRFWLLSGGQTTSSTIWKASENGFTTGDFEFTFDVTCSDPDGKGVTAADAIAFKGPSYGVNLDNLVVTSVVVTYPNDVETTPVEDTNTEAPADETVENTETAEETTPAETGIALAVVPMMVAAAAVVASKRR